MKVKKLITAATCAALITAAALPLSACGSAKSFKKGELNIAEYVQETPEYFDLFSRTGVSSVKEIATELASEAEVSGAFAITHKTKKVEVNEVEETQHLFTVYNSTTGKEVVSDVKGESSSYSGVISVSNRRVTVTTKVDVPVPSTGDDDDDDDAPATVKVPTYTIYGEDGTKLIENSYKTVTTETLTCWIGNDRESSKVLSLTGEDKDGIEFVNYYKTETDLFTREVKYTPVNKSDLHYVSPDYAAGTDKFGAVRHVYDDAEKPVNGEIASYTYAKVGNEMVFYNGGSETGRVKTDGMEAHAFVGNYLYYTVVTELPDDAKKANLIIPGGDKEYKCNYEIHKYDIVKNKDTKLKYSYYIQHFEPVYNYQKKAFDAVAVIGSKITKNTAQFNTQFTYVLTEELGLAYDITAVADVAGYNALGEIYKLDENKYMVGGEGSPVVVDENFELVSFFDGEMLGGYLSKEKLVMFEVGDGYGLVNLDGKIVVAPQYNFYCMYDGKTIAQNVVTGDMVILSADGTETKLPENKIPDASDMNELMQEGGSASYTQVQISDDGSWYMVMSATYKVTVDTEDPMKSYIDFSLEYKIHSAAGNVLKTYSDSTVIKGLGFGSGLSNPPVIRVEVDGNMLKITDFTYAEDDEDHQHPIPTYSLALIA